MLAIAARFEWRDLPLWHPLTTDDRAVTYALRNNSGSFAMFAAIRRASLCAFTALQAYHHGQHERGNQESECNVIEGSHRIAPSNKPHSL